MDFNSLTALSPLDGRYQNKVAPLSTHFSELALIQARTEVEIEWFLILSQTESFTALPAFSDKSVKLLRDIYLKFDLTAGERVKELEKETNHDVKAVEYYLKEQFQTIPDVQRYSEFLHFACTSEDINNLAYGLMLKRGMVPLETALDKITQQLQQLVNSTAEIAMLSRTHGQSASPTTTGKEIANWIFRLQRQRNFLNEFTPLAKINGAVGNYNAHMVSCPEVDWVSVSQQLIQHLGLHYNPYTTQIEPHDSMAELFDTCARINTILIDLCRDFWSYISLNYFKQKLSGNEVGSSTMPHKVNPIDFENAEGNLGMANALLHHFSSKLPVSRWQRDLTDSTVQRNIGVAFAYSLLAYESLSKGLNKVEVNHSAIAADLEQSWEVLAEAIQTVMRRYQIEQPYEKLKALTRGKEGITQQTLATFIDTLDIPVNERDRLKTLTPQSYIGNAVEQARQIDRFIKK